MGTGASRTVYAPGSNPKARISFDLHGCVTLMSMPRTALEPLDSSWQPARFVVLDDRRLQVNRVDHRSLAGCSLHNLGSGQQVAAGAQRRGDAPRIRSATRLSCSERATMCPTCAHDYAHGAELRAGGPQLPYLLAMAAASLSCPRWQPRRCHSRRPSPVAWDPIVEQLKLDWSIAVLGFVAGNRGECLK